MSLATKEEKSRSSVLQTLSALWSWLFLAFLIVFFEVWARVAFGQTFVFNLNSVQSILMAAVQPLLLGLGLTFVIVAGGIDLSVGFIVGLASVIGARVMQELGSSVPPFLGLLIGVAVALVASLIPGLINGLLIARLKVPPFIGTLGMYGIARGFGYLSANGVTVPVDNKVNSDFGNTSFLGIVPIPVLVTIILVFIMHYVLSQTKFGQYTYAIGGNKQAAQRAGINVERHTVGTC